MKRGLLGVQYPADDEAIGVAVLLLGLFLRRF